VGSQFEAPSAVDGGLNSLSPRFEMNGRGIGAAVATGPDGSVVGALVDKTDTFAPGVRLDAAGSSENPLPAVAVGERRQVAVAWRAQGAGPATIQARFRPDAKPFEAEATLSVPEFGAVAEGPEISATKNGDFAVAFVQGPTEARRLVVSVYDRPPSAPVGRSTNRYQRRQQPVLKWAAGSDLWGPQQFKVFLDGAEVGTTSRPELLVPAPLPEGAHRWRVQAIDRRGQAVASQDRLLRIDTAPPVVKVKVAGKRRRGQALRFTVTARDSGSGVNAVRLEYGDRTAPSTQRRSVHRYRRGGTYTVRARVSDRRAT
jgi:hypothetical protein